MNNIILSVNKVYFLYVSFFFFDLNKNYIVVLVFNIAVDYQAIRYRLNLFSKLRLKIDSCLFL